MKIMLTILGSNFSSVARSAIYLLVLLLSFVVSDELFEHTDSNNDSQGNEHR